MRVCGVAVGRLATVCAAAAVGLALLGGAGAANPEGWATYGGDPGRSGAAAEALPPLSVRPDVVLQIRGRVTSQVLAARDVPKPGLTTLYVATSAGVLYGLGESGYVRWRIDLGRLPNACPQLDGYGVTGTPVIDAASRSLFAADALGRLHDLDLATGAERPGWPVTLYSDPGLEHVWGALALADGRVYVPTGSYCDGGPFIGKVISVDVSTQSVSAWQAVPAELGGGGGIWGGAESPTAARSTGCTSQPGTPSRAGRTRATPSARPPGTGKRSSRSIPHSPSPVRATLRRSTSRWTWTSSARR